jgi:tetratricopeptide (TPR) repeat protein
VIAQHDAAAHLPGTGILGTITTTTTMQPPRVKRLIGIGLSLVAWLLSSGMATASSLDTRPLAAAHVETTPPIAEASLSLFSSMTPLEQRLFADAKDGRFAEFSLFEAALIASGIGDADTLAYYETQMNANVERLRAGGAVRGTQRQQAQAIFEFLHRQILNGGYALECTDLRQALDHGRFNCVSASVLFNCLAGEFHLKVCGLESPGHAMSRLQLAEGALDIETTCPKWFQLIEQPQKRAEQAEKALKHLPAGDRRKVREVTPVELIAMIYYNRGVDLLGQKHFAEAAAANAKALRLDPSNLTARGNFLATINNWAIDLGASRHFDEAAELLRLGMSIEPRYDAFATNYVQLCRQWTNHLCAAGRFEQALQLLARAADERPNEAYFRQAQSDVYRRWAENGQRGE